MSDNDHDHTYSPSGFTLRKIEHNKNNQLESYDNTPNDDLTTLNLDNDYENEPNTEIDTSVGAHFESFDIIETPIEYQRYIELKKFKSMIKMFSIILILYAGFSLLFRLYYVIGGAIVGIYGLWASRSMRRFYLLIFLGGLLLDGLIEGIGAIIVFSSDRSENKINTGGWLSLFTHIVAVGLKMTMLYYFYSKWKVVPKDGLDAYQQFRSNRQRIDNEEYIV